MIYPVTTSGREIVTAGGYVSKSCGGHDPNCQHCEYGSVGSFLMDLQHIEPCSGTEFEIGGIAATEINGSWVLPFAGHSGGSYPSTSYTCSWAETIGRIKSSCALIPAVHRNVWLDLSAHVDISTPFGISSLVILAYLTVTRIDPSSAFGNICAASWTQSATISPCQGVLFGAKANAYQLVNCCTLILSQWNVAGGGQVIISPL